ncbi:hypothetical protein DEI82_15445 [Curtobacterium sp. MCBD17_019]|nr:hypothetical protein DEI82_15445 [Curtobacterium sp. MCBD17_019]
MAGATSSARWICGAAEVGRTRNDLHRMGGARPSRYREAPVLDTRHRFDRHFWMGDERARHVETVPRQRARGGGAGGLSTDVHSVVRPSDLVRAADDGGVPDDDDRPTSARSDTGARRVDGADRQRSDGGEL